MNKKEKCGRKRKRKAIRGDEDFFNKEKKIKSKKKKPLTAQDLGNVGIIIHDSTVRKRLIEGRRKKNTDHYHEEKRIFYAN